MDDFRHDVRTKVLVLCVTASDVQQALLIQTTGAFDELDDRIRVVSTKFLKGAQRTAFGLRYFATDAGQAATAFEFQRDADGGMVRNSNRAVQRLVDVLTDPNNPDAKKARQLIANAWVNRNENVQ